MTEPFFNRIRVTGVAVLAVLILASISFMSGDIVITVIAIVMIIAVAAALVLAKSAREEGPQYVPPGQPAYQSHTHQHASHRPVIQQELGRPCPKCGASVPRGAQVCARCGTRI